MSEGNGKRKSAWIRFWNGEMFPDDSPNSQDAMQRDQETTAFGDSHPVPEHPTDSQASIPTPVEPNLPQSQAAGAGHKTSDSTRSQAPMLASEELSTDPSDIDFPTGRLIAGLVLVLFGILMALQVDWSVMLSQDSDRITRYIQDSGGFWPILAPVMIFGGIWVLMGIPIKLSEQMQQRGGAGSGSQSDRERADQESNRGEGGKPN